MKTLMIVLLVVLGVGTLIVANVAASSGEPVLMQTERETFPPCPSQDLSGAPLSGQGVNLKGKPWCLYGLPHDPAMPCPIYWGDKPYAKVRKLANGQTKCVYTEPGGD